MMQFLQLQRLDGLMRGVASVLFLATKLTKDNPAGKSLSCW
jgi:hypothetical protein